MRDYYDLDSAPVEESCLQVGQPEYYSLVKQEITALKHQFIRVFGEPPQGSYFKTASNPHDAGTYHSLQYIFDDENGAHQRYLEKIESHMEQWDQQARQELPPEYWQAVHRDYIETPKGKEDVTDIVQKLTENGFVVFKEADVIDPILETHKEIEKENDF
jgi:hypothetical protein